MPDGHIDINSITPYERNARTHSQEQLEKIENSIKEFGFIAPVIIDENNMILAGHGRVESAKRAGLKEVPYRRITNLTTDQKKAYILADNKLSDMAGWDLDLLNEELELIELDMTEFGFDSFEEEVEINDDDYEIDEEVKEAKSQVGQIYKLGNHFLMCGDSTKADDVEKLMNGELADLVVTDPPYNVNVSNSDGMQIENDDMPTEVFRDFIYSAFYNMSNSLKTGGAFYIWHGDSESINFRTACFDNGLLIKQCLIWVKNSFTFGRQDYQWQHEPCLYGWKEGASHYFIDEFNNATVIEDKGIDFNNLKREQAIEMLKNIYNNETTVIHEDKPIKNDLHPTMKPITLLARLIRNSSKKGEVVLDLFGGSGSTLIACEQLERTCYMMEYDPLYMDVIIDRWETLTGQKAILIN